MKSKVIKKERKQKINKKNIYLVIIFFLILLELVLYLIDVSKAETATLNVEYQDYNTSEIVESTISVESDENGNYIILPEEINEKQVSSYYVEEVTDGETTTKEYNINEKYYITEQNKIRFSVLYESSEENGEVIENKEEVIYIGEIGQEGEERTKLNPYKTIETAVSQITGESATIVVEGNFTMSSWASKSACANKKITLNIERTYSLNVITSILAHEISHYFLKVHNIRLQNKMQNEKLTDTTAIYLGFSKYLLDGYKKFETISGNSNTRRYTKIGYLEIIDIKYIIHKLNKIKHGYNDS